MIKTRKDNTLRNKLQKEKKLRDVTICPDHPRCATPSNLSRGVGSRTWSTVTGFIKLSSGILAPWGFEICNFPMLSAMAYITGQEDYRSSCDKLIRFPQESPSLCLLLTGRRSAYEFCSQLACLAVNALVKRQTATLNITEHTKPVSCLATLHFQHIAHNVHMRNVVNTMSTTTTSICSFRGYMLPD